MSDYTKKYESEELKDITLTSNIKSHKITIIFIFSFLILALIISALIKYPEKIIGKAFVVSVNQINNIYSPNNGEIILLVKENENVQKGDLIALINNPTNYYDLQKLKKQLSLININYPEKTLKNLSFDDNLKLGEIEKYYYTFLLAIIEYNNLLNIDITGQRIVNLKNKILRNKSKYEIGVFAKAIFDKKHSLLKESFQIDSVLFEENIIVQDQITESKLSILNSEEKEISIDKSIKELIGYNEEFSDEIILLKKEKQKNIASSLFGVKKSFFELKTALDFWEYNYTIKAPVSGKIEFYQPFFNSNQYVKKDMPLFILLPKIENLYVKGIMSANGYGKIKDRDTVYIKLKDYPYKEYGELKGIIDNKSKVYHDSIYYVDIKLTNGLKTNYDKIINFSHNMSGDVIYFTNKRSILQRVFSEIQNSIEDK